MRSGGRGGKKTMNVEGSVTRCIADLKAGQDLAADKLWQVYFQRLVGLARAKLGTRPRPWADEEDVALSAFKSLCLGAACGRFPELRDRDNLWPLLVVLTAHKATDLIKHQQRQKRGGKHRPDSADLEAILSREPTPEFSAMVAENCARLLDRLEPPLRQIAQLRLDGCTNIEIATRLKCALRTVERRLELIRRIWNEELS
jgi:DNA-directed RNA polymerase specialized sigma24 family protein